MTIRSALFACLLTLFALFPQSSESAEIPEAVPDKGLVVFYREKNFKGGAVRFNVQSANGVIGTLKNGSVLHTYLEPGQHTFWSEVISQDSVTVNVEAGQVYYVKGETKLGVYAGRPRLNQVSESQAKAELAQL